MKTGLRLISLFFMIQLTACEQFAQFSTSEKHAQIAHTSLAKHAKRTFWQTLHQGRYQDIDAANTLLTAAYLQTANDPELAAYIGFLHIWKITERGRLKTESPFITNEIILSSKYFSDALSLDPKNSIFLGFLGDSHLVEGKIFGDERQQTRGYFELQRAIHAWPEFNYFTAGYPMSSLPATSKYFQEGVDWQWKTLDLCADHRIDRQHPDFKPYMHRETQQGAQRACWNSWAAPHNFEGFFLNMGDMVVKSGDWQTGIQLYQNTKLSKTYYQWPYRSLLEKRIRQAKINVTRFNESHKEADKTVMFHSGYGCVACHQY